MRRSEEALVEVNPALREDPNSADGHFARGKIQRQLGNLEESRTSLMNALKLNKELPGAWDALVNVLLTQGRTEEARAAFRRALEVEPRTAEELNQRGWAWLRFGDPRKALACFERVSRLAPDSADYRANKGMALTNLGQHREALAVLDPLVKSHPDVFTAHMARYLASQNLGRWPQMLEAARHLVRLRPADGDLHMMCGKVCLAAGQKSEALRALDKALELGSESPSTRALRGQGFSCSHGSRRRWTIWTARWSWACSCRPTARAFC